VVTIDRSSPTAKVPAITFDVGSRVTKSEIDAWVAASATDTGSGMAKLALQRRSGTSWSTLSSVTASSVAILRTLSMSGSHGFRARGTDRIGHVGTWATTSTLVPTLRSDAHGTVTYSSGWTTVANTSALGNSLHRTSSTGARATFQFTGRAIGIVAPRGSSYGKFEVLIDGIKVATVDLRRATARSRVLVFAKSWSTAGAHVVVVRNLGAGGRPVALDGFVYLP
jgi:hypothetical protein